MRSTSFYLLFLLVVDFKRLSRFVFFFFFNDTATTEIYTLSLHDALPISCAPNTRWASSGASRSISWDALRSEEHTSEIQSPYDVVCRLLLEKKKNISSRKEGFSAEDSDMTLIVFIPMYGPFAQ